MIDRGGGWAEGLGNPFQLQCTLKRIADLNGVLCIHYCSVLLFPYAWLFQDLVDAVGVSFMLFHFFVVVRHVISHGSMINLGCEPSYLNVTPVQNFSGYRRQWVLKKILQYLVLAGTTFGENC